MNNTKLISKTFQLKIFNMKKQIMLKSNNAILYRFSSEQGYYYIVTRLNFNKKGKRKSMYFKNYEDAKQRFVNLSL